MIPAEGSERDREGGEGRGERRRGEGGRNVYTCKCMNAYLSLHKWGYTSNSCSPPLTFHTLSLLSLPTHFHPCCRLAWTGEERQTKPMGLVNSWCTLYLLNGHRYTCNRVHTHTCYTFTDSVRGTNTNQKNWRTFPRGGVAPSLKEVKGGGVGEWGVGVVFAAIYFVDSRVYNPKYGNDCLLPLATS